MKGRRRLRGGIEQAFGAEPALAFFDQRHQCTRAGGLERLDDDLILRRSGECRHLAGGDHLHTLFRAKLQFGERALPDDGIDTRAIVLQGEIGVAGGMRPAIAGDLAAHTHLIEGGLHGPLDGAGELGNRVFGEIARRIILEDAAHIVLLSEEVRKSSPVQRNGIQRISFSCIRTAHSRKLGIAGPVNCSSKQPHLY
jgi:hypothetical protein